MLFSLGKREALEAVGHDNYLKIADVLSCGRGFIRLSLYILRELEKGSMG